MVTAMLSASLRQLGFVGLSAGYGMPMAMAAEPDEFPSEHAGFEDREPAEKVGDHAMGLELELVEVVEQIKRAQVQERWDDLRDLRTEEARLEAELVRTAEVAGRLAE